MKALAESAVTAAIPPDDLSGATFTVSNLGSLGIESFTPLINPPQVAILGVGAIQPRVVRAQDRDVVRIREHPRAGHVSPIRIVDSWDCRSPATIR